MIVVTNVRTVLHDDDVNSRVRVMSRHEPIGEAVTFEAPHEAIRVTTEMIDGRVFKNAYGWDVTIGWDKAAQESLGLPFKAFEEQRRQINSLKGRLANAEAEVRCLQGQCNMEKGIMESFIKYQKG